MNCVTPDRVIDLDDGWLNVMPLHWHWRPWKPWCAMLEVWTFGEDEPTVATSKYWTRRAADRERDALLEDLGLT